MRIWAAIPAMVGLLPASILPTLLEPAVTTAASLPEFEFLRLNGGRR